MKIFKILAIIFLINSNLNGQWSHIGKLNANGDVLTICSDKNGNIYAAGKFTKSGTITPDSNQYVAKFDGTSWTEVGASTNPFISNIHSMCLDLQGNIYAAGTFTNYNTSGMFYRSLYVAKFDGTSWSELGGLNALNKIYPGIWYGGIYTICSDKNDNIYASGGFYNSLGKRYVTKYNGTSWSELKMGAIGLNANGDVLTICSDKNGNIYAAGKFTNGTSSSNGKKYVAKFDGTSWSELGGLNSLNANNDILSICSDKNGNIYAAGAFNNGTNTYVAKFDGTSWSELGGLNSLIGVNDLNAGIYSICSDSKGQIFAGGTFVSKDKIRYVAKFDGTSWSKLLGMNGLNPSMGSVWSLHCDGSDNIYAAGSINNGIGNISVAKYNNSINSRIESALTGDLISIYPTPIKCLLNIKISPELLNSDFKIYNSYGVMILNGKLNTEDTSFDMEPYSSGIYLIRIGEENYKKVIVSK